MTDTIKNILSSIWINQLRDYFDNTTFCSERHFQAEFYKQLTIELEKISPDFKVFVEPVIKMRVYHSPKKTSYYDTRPDLVIAYQQQLLGIIELKYQIKSPATLWEKDIWKLEGFAKGALEVNTKIFAQLEETGDEPYTLNTDILCCFAVITKETAPALQNSIWQKFPSENWLHLRGTLGLKKVIFATKSSMDELA